jgi:hypothetical protein
LNQKVKIGLGLGTVAVAALVTILVFTVISLPLNNKTHTIVAPQSNKPESAFANVLLWRNGQCVYNYTSPDLLVTAGSTWIKNFLSTGTSGATNATNSLAVGTNGTPTIGQTVLTSEQTGNGLARVSNTSVSINATAYYVVYTWTASGSATLNATSLSRSSTSNGPTAVAIISIASASVITNDKLQVKVTVNCPTG